jgi:hypothetical protein
LASETSESKRQVEKVLDKYSGSDPDLYKWDFTLGNRGVKKYELHPAHVDDEEDPSRYCRTENLKN